jgi:thioredoxin 1
MKISDWLGKAEFQKVVSEPGPHVIVFAAKWCRYCSRFLGQAKSFQNPANAELNLLDADNPDESLWDDFSIKKVPTIVVFKDGKSIFRIDARSPLSLSGGGLKMSDLEQGLSACSSAS